MKCNVQIGATAVRLAKLSVWAVFFVSIASRASAGMQGAPGKALFPTDDTARSAGPGHSWQGGPSSVNPYSLAKQTDIKLVSWRARGGLPVEFGLHHCSQGYLTNPALGPKWLHTYDVTLITFTKTLPHKAALIWGDQRIQTFVRSGGVWVPTDGYRDTLTVNGGGFRITLKNQLQLNLQPGTGSVPFIKRYRLASMVDPSGNSIACQYNLQGRLTLVTDPSGRTLSLAYSGAGKLDTLTFGVGAYSRVWTLSYDVKGRVSRVDLPPVTTDLGVQNYFCLLDYNGDSNVTSMTNAEGLTTQYGYSGDEIAYIQKPGNSVGERVLFTRSGPLRTVSDPLGNTRTNEYDSLSRLIRTRDEADFDTYLSFTDPDYIYGPASVQTPAGEVYGWDLDNDGFVVGRTDAAGNRWDYQYDARNNLTRAEAPLVTNAWGIPDGARHRTDYVYDANNRRVETRRYTGPITFQTTTYAYDNAGNLISTTNPLQKTWTFQRDQYGNATMATTPEGRTVTSVYDSAAQTAGFTAPNATINGLGVRTDFSRDEWGRTSVVVFPSQENIAYRYDGLNRLVRTVGPEGETLYTYEQHGWLASLDQGQAEQIYGYDAAGRRTSMTETSFSGQRMIQYGYDARGLMTTLVDGPAFNTMDYDANGRILNRYFANGAKTHWTYSQGRLASKLQQDTVDEILHQSFYSYQADGKLAETNEMAVFSSAIVRRGYDFLGRTVREERNDPVVPHDISWTYDAAGNRASQTWANYPELTYAYTSDDDNNLVEALSAGEVDQYTNDANGQLVRRVRGNQDLTFAYNSIGQLTEIERKIGGNYQPFASYSWDAFGRAATRRIRVGQFDRDYTFSYDGNDLVRADHVRNGNAGVQTMTWGPGGLYKFVESTQSQISGVLATDGLGNARARTNLNGGQSGFDAIYNAFGQTALLTGSPSGYTYQADQGWRSELEAEAGLVRLGSLFYDTTTDQALAHGPLSGFTQSGGAWLTGVAVDQFSVGGPIGLHQDTNFQDKSRHLRSADAYTFQFDGWVGEQPDGWCVSSGTWQDLDADYRMSFGGGAGIFYNGHAGLGSNYRPNISFDPRGTNSISRNRHGISIVMRDMDSLSRSSGSGWDSYGDSNIQGIKGDWDGE